ncbi:hypothetical protein [Nostoc sp. FACHB-145]|uniref:hypothetical protein n=1 Tax=Nostoc sp. FACHB-145 TaxID=2692836 RepID=UPI001685328B|nr:hypothetical protein [Nostoc sp. FACHB-145]MBD2472399.1 hypothetical protein [Nostoc sp. FACHB-145]
MSTLASTPLQNASVKVLISLLISVGYRGDLHRAAARHDRFQIDHPNKIFRQTSHFEIVGLD